ILFWDNGNEGGWTTGNDGEFAKWDPQQRVVFHPRSLDHGVNDPHYPIYSEVVRDVDGPQIYFPTEYLHGVYDGGSGTAFHDYWEVMKHGKALGGAVFWVLTDEAVVRTDENGRLDARGNYAPDGITGPHREKEGSFYTIKQIWSPVQVTGISAQGRLGRVTVENDYDFTNLNQCTFTWETAVFSAEGTMAGHQVLASGRLPGPDVVPHEQGILPLPSGWDLPAGQVLYLTAQDPQGRELWRWSFPMPAFALEPATTSTGTPPTSRDDGTQIIVTAGTLELRFSKETGLLAGVLDGGRPISLDHGPYFVAARHVDPVIPERQGVMPVTKYTDVSRPGALTGLTARVNGSDMVVDARYNGSLTRALWRISPTGKVQLDYNYTFNGQVDLLGVSFDYPEANMKGVTWQGWGPYRVWQNRLEGTTLDVWYNAHNDSVPGARWEYPEFQGYFCWKWAVFDTTEGQIWVRNLSSRDTYLGVYTPHDGTVIPLLELPQTGLAFFNVIPANRDKFKVQEQLGPQSQPKTVSGEVTGSVEFEFKAK
ncbi:MAG TPA: beta-galactosidase domain 4-containing protein, partial [Verrucomicrobiae bacterium]|nr:beta-galactosidase domain 4-containing protein [Verrucomicrobiae bacterium]